MDPSHRSSFPMWGAPPPLPPAPSDGPSAAMPPSFLPPPNANRGWKRKNPNSNSAGYQPPAIGDLQVQNRAKARRWFKSHNPNPNNSSNRKHFFPKPKAAAPRNTTSFIIRAKRAGGIASLVSPCPVTPAVLPTPRISPSREGLSDMAQQQWGVDGYGSMKGLIRLRSSPQPANAAAVSDDEEEENSSGSDVEEHVEVERRLDHDLSRFEMVYPGRGEEAGGYVFEEDDEYDQDVHVARLEEENLTLKERLFLMEQEVGDMRRRLEALEARFSGPDAVGGADASAENAVEENGTARGNAAAVAENEVQEALVNGTDRGAENQVQDALVNGTDRGAENQVQDALVSGTERAAENAVEEALENGMETVDVVSEKSGEGNTSGDVVPERSCESNTSGDVVTEKSSEGNTSGDVVLEKSVVAGSEKSSEKNTERGDAGSGEDNGEESRPEASALN